MKSYIYVLSWGLILFFSVVLFGISNTTGAVVMNNDNLEKATFAGGCFWCMESDFEKIDGVKAVLSGYTGGKEKDPTYKEVSAGLTGHVEAVLVEYDAAVVSYETLLDVFWRHVDPTDPQGQFVDRGPQYQTGIFYHNEVQRLAAEKSREALAASGRFNRPIVTKIAPATAFYEAEAYHQDYYKKSPMRYKFYRYSSGRDQFLSKTWTDDKPRLHGGDTGQYSRPGDDVIRSRLTSLQYRVTQSDGTEPPFDNAYWNNKEEGIYVDIVSGEPLFSSSDKFDSGTGWPSFSRALITENVVEIEDKRYMMVRTEVRSKHGDSHLGHLFRDGPPPTGNRYCINSASLRFVPRANMEKEGYGRYLELFNK